MKPIRQWRKTGAALGLFALALQLWLSFGHVHTESVATAQIEATALSAPGDHDDAALHRDLCAICVTAQLLASSLVPLAPALPLRPAIIAAGHTPLVGPSTPGKAPRRFLARAPPLA
jgi:hypothetical protein